MDLRCENLTQYNDVKYLIIFASKGVCGGAKD